MCMEETFLKAHYKSVRQKAHHRFVESHDRIIAFLVSASAHYLLGPLPVSHKAHPDLF